MPIQSPQLIPEKEARFLLQVYDAALSGYLVISKNSYSLCSALLHVLQAAIHPFKSDSGTSAAINFYSVLPGSCIYQLPYSNTQRSYRITSILAPPVIIFPWIFIFTLALFPAILTSSTEETKSLNSLK